MTIFFLVLAYLFKLDCDKSLQLILITFESASWNQPVLVSYEEHGRDPSRARIYDLWVERQTP
jgi:hypothetical protein